MCLALGALLALLYDGLRLLRLLFHHWSWLVDVEDLLYWLLTAWLVFRTLFYFNQGALRAYAFFGLLLGVIFYALTMSRWVMWGVEKILPFWNRGKEYIKKPVLFLTGHIRKGLKNVVADVKMAVRGR